MRTFLALQLSQETKKRLAQVTAQLGVTGADVKWVEEDNFHITLFFLGETDPETCETIIGKMPMMAAGVEPFAINLDGMGAFPNLKKPRVIWVGVKEGGREIVKVYRRVLGVMEPLGFVEEKKFSPHVTIGRVRSRAGGRTRQSSLQELVGAMEKVKGLGEDYIRGISLMESHLTSKGAIYSELAFAKFLPTKDPA